jgi:hypothetical protein
MKIIADMGEDKFLVEATRTEIANIIGVYGAPGCCPSIVKGATSTYDTDKTFRVGATFAMSPAYQWLAKFKERRADALKSTAIMRAFLDHVDGNIPEIVPPIVLTPDDAKEAEKF